MKTCFKLLAAVALFAFAGCNDDRWDGYIGDELPYEEYLIEASSSSFGDRYESLKREEVYVIYSAAEYAELFGEEPDPAIDFSASTLLFMWGESPSPGSVGEVEFYYNTRSGMYLFYVEVKLPNGSAPTILGYWRTFILVDRLPADAVVNWMTFMNYNE